MLSFVRGREVEIVLVIAPLAAGGSQLPKLVRALARSSPTDKSTANGAAEDAGTTDPAERPWSA